MNSVNFWRFATLTSVLFSVVALALIVQLSLVTGSETDSGTAVKQVKSVGETNQSNTISQGYTNVPGAVTTVTVPPGEKALILSRFTGQSSCTQNPIVGNFCYVRVTINGVDQGEVIFDSVRATDSAPSSHSFETANTFGSGTYYVRVQYKVDEDNAGFFLSNWRLTVERIKK